MHAPTHRERPLAIGGGSLERHHDDGHPVHAAVHGQRCQVGQVDRHLAGKVVPLQAVVVEDAQQQDGAPRRQVLLGHVGAGRHIVASYSIQGGCIGWGCRHIA